MSSTTIQNAVAPTPPVKRPSPTGTPSPKRTTLIPLKPSRSLSQSRVRVSRANKDPTFRLSKAGHLLCNSCNCELDINCAALDENEQDRRLQSFLCISPLIEFKWKTYFCAICNQTAVMRFIMAAKLDGDDDDAGDDACSKMCTNCIRSEPEVCIIDHPINIASRMSATEPRVLQLCAGCTTSCANQLASLKK